MPTPNVCALSNRRVASNTHCFVATNPAPADCSTIRAQTALPGDLAWEQEPFLWNHAVWDAAVAKGTVRLMSLKEANRHQEFYELMAFMNSHSLADWDAINTARRFDLLDSDPTHLSSVQLVEVIQLTETALAKHIQLGNSFGRYAHEFPELPHSITLQS
jgi:hypothetical protein